MISRRTTLALALALASPGTARAAKPARPGDDTAFSSGELMSSGHRFFGNVSRGLGATVEEAVRRWGEPNAYILGQEGGGALIGGVRYGEGKIYRRRTAGSRVFWQGPSVGFDVGGEGARTMMLVYGLADPADLYRRFAEIDGSAYFLAGFGMTAARADDIVVVPIRSGVGLRLGINVGYLKFTDAPTWNPF